MKIAENDKCVLCGRDAGVPADMPVSERKNYVKGCGVSFARIAFTGYTAALILIAPYQTRK